MTKRTESKKDLAERIEALHSACHVRESILDDMQSGVEPLRFEKKIETGDLSAPHMTVIANVYRSHAFHGGYVAVTETTHYANGGSSVHRSYFYLTDWVARCRDMTGVGGFYHALYRFAESVESKCAYARVA